MVVLIATRGGWLYLIMVSVGGGWEERLLRNQVGHKKKAWEGKKIMVGLAFRGDEVCKVDRKRD